jgi:Icc-related predicted phosphoesterase
MIIDCIGCLHGYRPKLEGGDLLIITGDLTASDKPHQYPDFFQWLFNQKYKKKVLIGGNHDNAMKSSFVKFDSNSQCDYLCDSSIEFEDIKIYGSPWTKTFPGINAHCRAFTCETEEQLAEKWALIPNDVDILVTHSPAFGILDGIPLEDGSLFHAGSKSLLKEIKRIDPRLVIHSHIHEAYGQTDHFPEYEQGMITTVNCSIMNERYKPDNAPIRFIL